MPTRTSTVGIPPVIQKRPLIQTLPTTAEINRVYLTAKAILASVSGPISYSTLTSMLHASCSDGALIGRAIAGLVNNGDARFLNIGGTRSIEGIGI